ncbi:hypothetical protein J6590_085232 [Homalodisca vitripennis]|nr:hypothetical protein J6590_085232 [Homalodisca vitripennis]
MVLPLTPPRYLVARRGVHCLYTIHCTTLGSRLDEQYPLTLLRHLTPQRGVPCLYTTHYNTASVAARRAITTYITPSLGVTTRRAVATDVTPSPRCSAQCPLLVHYTLQHSRGHD